MFEFDTSNDHFETIPLNEEKREQTEPCDPKAFKWCCRTCTMVTIAVMLLSMTLVAWQQYTTDLNMDDKETPTVLAMGHTCKNHSYNLEPVSNVSGYLVYEVSYFEDETSYDLLYLDTQCMDANVSFPYLFFTVGDCCRFVLYNTI